MIETDITTTHLMTDIEMIWITIVEDVEIVLVILMITAIGIIETKTGIGITAEIDIKTIDQALMKATIIMISGTITRPLMSIPIMPLLKVTITGLHNNKITTEIKTLTIIQIDNGEICFSLISGFNLF